MYRILVLQSHPITDKPRTPYDYISLFFECYGDHRDLPSFPTRRSSDLVKANDGPRGLGRAVAKALHVEPGSGRRRIYRSEEHTSELQSPVHLVCRLLLEKKKKEKVKQAARHRE